MEHRKEISRKKTKSKSTKRGTVSNTTVTRDINSKSSEKVVRR